MVPNRPALARAAAAVKRALRRAVHVWLALTLLASVLSLVSYDLPHAEAQMPPEGQSWESGATGRRVSR